MKNWYRKVEKRISLPWGGIRKMSKQLNIGQKSLGRILDGQKAGKWHFEYSFDEIRKIAINQYEGIMRK